MPLPTRLIHFALDQVPSFSAYLPYLAYDPDHQLYLVAKDNDTTKLAWGVIFECLPHPAPGEKQATNLKGIFDLTLPMGSTIQITAAALQTETIPTLLLYRSLRHGLQHTEHANRRIHRLAGLLLSGSQELQTAPLRNTVVLVSLSIPIPPHRRTWHARLQTLRRLLAAQTGGLQYATVMAALPQVKRAATDIEQLLIQASLFPQRVLAGQHFGGEYRVGRRPGAQHRGAPSLAGDQPQALQPGRFGHRPLFAGRLGVRRG